MANNKPKYQMSTAKSSFPRIDKKNMKNLQQICLENLKHSKWTEEELMEHTKLIFNKEKQAQVIELMYQDFSVSLETIKPFCLNNGLYMVRFFLNLFP